MALIMQEIILHLALHLPSNSECHLEIISFMQFQANNKMFHSQEFVMRVAANGQINVVQM